MGLRDFEVFIQERLRRWDETLDLSSGSPIDAEVIQPILRRIGTDPFTVDAATFIIERLQQEFPDLAASDGDATSDLLVKPALLLWDPIIREIQRVKNMLSLRDPALLTTEEAEALGANTFSERNKGSFARGVARIYFAQPQSVRVTPTNFFTSRDGFHYFPTEIQAVKVEEMMLNKEGDLYFFDINVIAEQAGDAYNIGPSELVTIANITSAVRVTNKARFRFGLPEEDAATFVGRIEQDLSERSLVTQRGIVAKLTRAFPEVTRLNIVGFNDPEMNRDVISGGSLGPLLAAGSDLQSMPDGEYRAQTRRVSMASADFFALIGPVGPARGFVLTVFDAFITGAPTVQDLLITRVVNQTTVEVNQQVIKPGTSSKVWCLRRSEITLSNIPGGIVVPDSSTGTVAVAPDQLHIGGCTDILVRGVDFDTASVVIDSVTDEAPTLQGAQFSTVLGPIELKDLVLTVNYQIGDDTYTELQNARYQQYTLEVLDGANAGVYRILDVVQVPGASPVLFLDKPTVSVSGDFRWRLLDEININLIEPKEVRNSGTTGKTIQNVSYFTTSPATDFDALGVSVGDILRVLNGPDKGDFTVEEIIAPFFSQIRLDRVFTASRTGVSFSIFRPNAEGGVQRPLVRITEVNILDASNQPIGSKIPYAKPVDIRSRAFQNPGAGDKVAFTDGTLGIVSIAEGPGYNFLAGGTVSFTWDGAPAPITVTFLVGLQSALAVRNAINAASQSAVGYDIAVVLPFNGQNYIGITPIGPGMRTTSPSTAHNVLFGDNTVRTGSDVRSASVPSWTSVSPAIDAALDALWVRDGVQVGFYRNLTVGWVPPSLGNSTALRAQGDFAPELGRSIVVGARSLGSARMYFLEPTSVEIDEQTVFTVVTTDDQSISFLPDPTLRRQLFPALPNGVKPTNGESWPGGDATKFTSTGVDFIRQGVKEGDYLTIDFVQLLGSVSLADPVPGLSLKDIRLSVDGQTDKIITFTNDVLTPGAVSRSGVASQINAAVGMTLCSLFEVSPGNVRLRFNPEFYLVVRQQASNPNQANTILGFSNASDTNNKSPNAGEYRIVLITGDTLSLDSAQPIAKVNQQYTINRVGSQRISATQMADNRAEAQLYYWDVELVSEGVGNLWNIGAEELMVVAGYRSDGYYLTTLDPNLSFSAVEDLQLHLSRSILEVGVDDSPENATQLSGQNISISYAYSSLVQQVQNFTSSEGERVVNQSPLSRHLVPHFVRFDLTYAGGSRETEVTPDLETYIREVLPDGALEASDLQKVVSDRGATSIENPINMMAVVHNFDRSIVLARSQNALTTGRLAAFIPDVLTITRKLV